MHKELKLLLTDNRIYHDEIQMDSFITSAHGGTEYGMYQQALCELNKRTRGLRQLHGDQEIQKIDLDELRVTKSTSEFDQRRNIINIRKKELQLEESEEVIADTEREFIHFFNQAKSLKEKIGELTPEKRATLDREMWIHKIQEMAAGEFLDNGRITSKTRDMLHYLPSDMKKVLMDKINNPDNLMEWFQGLKYDLPSRVSIEGATVRALLDGIDNKQEG